jgi:orotidine-5'-phosphate decarboxylase
MGFNQNLDGLLSKTDSRIVVGLDPVPERLPEGVRPDRAGLVRFLTAVVDATSDYAVGFKPNLAFFEALGEPGLAALGDVSDHVRETTSAFLLLDAKRGDVGHTAERYAHAAYQVHGADAVTVSPYMGFDAVEPFAREADRGVFVLARTSNPGAAEVQELLVGAEGSDGREPLFLHVARLVRKWDQSGNLGLVAGATNPGPLRAVREAVGATMPILVPGVGAQGGDLEQAVAAAADENGRGFLVAASRSVLYAGSGEDFAQRSAVAAKALAEQVASALAKPSPNP